MDIVCNGLKYSRTAFSRNEKIGWNVERSEYNNIIQASPSE